MVSEITQCWVLNCTTKLSEKQKLYPLPQDPQIRDTWLALAGKPVTTKDIYFCSNHFTAKVESEIIHSLPTQQMPQKICGLCLAFIESTGALLDESVNVLSNNIETEMPKIIDKTLSYYIKSGPLPLLKMLSLCMPWLEFPCNPPPLLCNACFTNIWLFYMYKVSAIDTEKKLLQAVTSLENYHKMFMCRSCPVKDGSFYVVAQGTPKADLMKTIFPENSVGKNSVLLRVCTNCFDVIKKLEAFTQLCKIADAKMKHQLELQREFAARKDALKEFEKTLHSRNRDISLLLKTHKNSTDSSESSKATTTVEKNGEDLPKCFTFEMLKKSSLSQWMKETFSQTMLDHGQNLKIETNQDKVMQTWLRIQEKLKCCGITMEILEMSMMWNELLETTTRKTQLKLPQDHLGKLIERYIQGTENQQAVGDDIFENSSSNNCHQSREGSRQSCLVSRTSLDDDAGRSPPVLTSQKSMSDQHKIPSKKMVFGRWRNKTDCWRTKTSNMNMLMLIEKEAQRLWNLKSNKDEQHRSHLLTVVKNVFNQNPDLPYKSVASMYNRLSYLRNNVSRHPKENNKELQTLFNRISQYISVKSTRFSTVKPKVITSHRNMLKDKHGVGRQKRKRNISNVDKLKLVEEMTKEFQRFKSLNLQTGSPWPKILVRMEKRKLLNCNFKQLNNLWNNMCMSATKPSKGNRNAVNSKVSQLLSDYVEYKNTFNINAETPNCAIRTNDNKNGDDNDRIGGTCGERELLNDNYRPSFKSKQLTKEKGKLCFDKFKFVETMRREFKMMCNNKESRLGKPFQRIHVKLAEKEYSEFGLKDLQNKWRNMKCLAIRHQKNGILSDLDKEVLNLLLQHKKQREDYKKIGDSDKVVAPKSDSSISETSHREDHDADDVLVYRKEMIEGAGVTRAAACHIQPNKIDRQVIELLKTNRIKTEPDESTNQDIKVEATSEREQENVEDDREFEDYDKDTIMDYDHISIRDIEAQTQLNSFQTPSKEVSFLKDEDIDQHSNYSNETIPWSAADQLEKLLNEQADKSGEAKRRKSTSIEKTTPVSFNLDDHCGLEDLLPDPDYSHL